MAIKKNTSTEVQPKANDPAEKARAARSPQHSGSCCSEKTDERIPHHDLPLSSGCCMGMTSHHTTEHSPLHLHAPSTPINGKLETKKGAKTKIVVHYDVGFQNLLTIRGKGANLTWERGIPLKNIKHDEWVWETDAPFSHGEFKILINDRHYEAGPNHLINCGTLMQYTPKF